MSLVRSSGLGSDGSLVRSSGLARALELYTAISPMCSMCGARMNERKLGIRAHWEYGVGSTTEAGFGISADAGPRNMLPGTIGSTGTGTGTRSYVHLSLIHI